MGNPSIEDEKTTINVKGISIGSWEQAKKAAHRAGISMGAWLSRACDQLAKLESGDRLILPGNPGKDLGNHRQPMALPEVDMNAIASVILAMKETGLPVQKRIGLQINSLLHAKLREAQGKVDPKDAQKLIGFTDLANHSPEPAILIHELESEKAI